VKCLCVFRAGKTGPRVDLFTTRDQFSINLDTTCLFKQVGAPNTTRPANPFKLNESCLTGQHDPFEGRPLTQNKKIPITKQYLLNIHINHCLI
jgi:hypothetical protein